MVESRERTIKVPCTRLREFEGTYLNKSALATQPTIDPAKTNHDVATMLVNSRKAQKSLDTATIMQVAPGMRSRNQNYVGGN